MLGYLMEKEVTAINNVLKNAQHPFTAIIGGSKVSSKLAVIKNLLDKVDNLIIGGGMVIPSSRHRAVRLVSHSTRTI